MTYLENLFSLEGKVAVITGASRGIGKGLTEALMKVGAQGLMVASNEERLAAATSEGAPSTSEINISRCVA